MAWRKQSTASASSLADRYGQDWTSIAASSAGTAPPDAGGGPVQQPSQHLAHERIAAFSAAAKSANLQADRVVTPRKPPVAPQPPPTSLADWTVAHVAEWVAATPLPLEVSERLRENAINGPVLESLTDQDMISMGLEKFGWRRQLFLSRQELFELMDSDTAGNQLLQSRTTTDSDSMAEWHQIHSRSPTDKGSPDGQVSPQRGTQQLERQQLERQVSLASSPTPSAPHSSILQPGLIRRPPSTCAAPPLPSHERTAPGATGPQAQGVGRLSSLRRLGDSTGISTPVVRGLCTPTHPSRAPAAAGGALHESTEPIAQQLVAGVATPTPCGGPPLLPGAMITPQLVPRLAGTASPPLPVSRQMSGVVRRRSPSPPAPLPPPPGTSKSSASIRVQSPSNLAASPASTKVLNAGMSPRVLVQSPTPRGLPAPAAAEEPASARGSLGRRPVMPASWGLQGSPHPGPTSGGSMKVAMLPLQQGSPQKGPTSGGSVSVAMLPLQHRSPQPAPTSGGSMSVGMPASQPMPGSPPPAPVSGRSMAVTVFPSQPGAQPVAPSPQQWASVAAPSRAGTSRGPGTPILRHGLQSPR